MEAVLPCSPFIHPFIHFYISQLSKVYCVSLTVPRTELG